MRERVSSKELAPLTYSLSRLLRFQCSLRMLRSSQNPVILQILNTVVKNPFRQLS